MKGTEEYRIGNAIVRVHPGKRTPEERRAAIEEAIIIFMKDVERQKRRAENAVDRRSPAGS